MTSITVFFKCSIKKNPECQRELLSLIKILCVHKSRSLNSSRRVVPVVGKVGAAAAGIVLYISAMAGLAKATGFKGTDLDVDYDDIDPMPAIVQTE